MTSKPKRVYLSSLNQPHSLGKLNHLPLDPLNHPRVQALRKYTRIEKLIRNKKTDLSRALTIARFTSSAWNHDGFNSNPKKQDALTILELAKKGASFSCVQFASVFVQLCQSVGIPARILQVRTKHPDLGSSGHGHVTAEYFDNDLGKWVWIDPQIHAYASYKGIPLSHNELAELFVKKLKPKIHFSLRTVQYLKGDKKQFTRLKSFIERYVWSSRISGLNSFYKNQNQVQLVGCMRKGTLPAITFQGFATQSAQFVSQEEFDAPLNSCQLNFKTFAPKTEYKWKDLKDYKENAHRNFALPIIEISFAHSMPWFEKFLVKINGKRKVVKGSSFKFVLSSGKNKIEVQAMNKAKRIGPLSTATVNYDSKYKFVTSYW